MDLIKLAEDLSKTVETLTTEIKVSDMNRSSLEGKLATAEHELAVAKQENQAYASLIADIRQKAIKQRKMDLVDMIDKVTVPRVELKPPVQPVQEDEKPGKKKKGSK